MLLNSNNTARAIIPSERQLHTPATHDVQSQESTAPGTCQQAQGSRPSHQQLQQPLQHHDMGIFTGPPGVAPVSVWDPAASQHQQEQSQQQEQPQQPEQGWPADIPADSAAAATGGVLSVVIQQQQQQQLSSAAEDSTAALEEAPCQNRQQLTSSCNGWENGERIIVPAAEAGTLSCPAGGAARCHQCIIPEASTPKCGIAAAAGTRKTSAPDQGRCLHL